MKQEPGMKIVLFSDVHLTAGRALAGVDPDARFRGALAHAAANHGDAEALFILGDLADDGSPTQYSGMAAAIAGFPLPVHLLLGNHDDRAAFRAAFGGTGYVQQVVTYGGVPFHLLDSLDGGRIGGSLGDGRLEALDAWLATSEAPGFVLMHHPPIVTGAQAFDRDGLTDLAGIRATLARHPGKVRAVFFGHCHMPVAGVLAGVPAFCVPPLVAPSMPVLDRPVYRDDPHGPVGYSVLLAGERDFSVHNIVLARHEATSRRDFEEAGHAVR